MNQFSSTLLVEEDMDSYRSVELPKLYEIENTAPGTGGKNREKQQKEKRKYPRYGSLGQGAYENALELVKKYAKEGKRYWMMYCLAATARSCAIPEDKIKKDAYGLLEYMDSLTENTSENRFTKSDIDCALRNYYYDGPFMRKSTFEEMCGVRLPGSIRRNGRTREEHMEYMKEKKEQKRQQGEPVDNGPALKWWPVVAYRLIYQQGKKAECEKATKLSRHTVLKYWGLWEGLLQSDTVFVNELSERVQGHGLEKVIDMAEMKEQVGKRLKELGLLAK